MKSHLQNGKQCKPTYNYSCRNEANNRMKEIRNGRKKEEITSYSDTFPEMTAKSDEHQYCTRMLQLIGLPTLLYQPGFIRTWR